MSCYSTVLAAQGRIGKKALIEHRLVKDTERETDTQTQDNI